MAIDLKHKKFFVGGVTGSGKTFFTEHKLLKAFKTPLVITPHREDFTKAHRGVLIFHLNPFTTENLNLFVKTHIKPLAYANKIDALVVDESDLLIPKTIPELQKHYNIYDMFINHRHWSKNKGKGIALGMITRRPQEMNTVFLEQAHNLFFFALEGKNVSKHLSAIHKDFEILLPKLSADNRKYIHKELGKKPCLHNPIKVQDGNKKTNAKKRSNANPESLELSQMGSL